MNKTELVNLALLTVGAKAITDYSESSYNGGLVRQFYPAVKERVLRSHNWNCAMTRQSLAQLADSPIFGYDYQYQLPTDCLRALKLNDGDSFHVEGRQLVTNALSANLLYIADIEAYQMDPLLARAVQYLLAAELANPLSANIDLARKLEEQYQRWILPKAIHMDGVESHGDQFYEGFMEPQSRIKGPGYHWYE